MVAITGQGAVRNLTDTGRAEPIARPAIPPALQDETLFGALPRRGPIGSSSGGSNRLRPRGPTPVNNDPEGNANALRVVAEHSPDSLVRLALRNSIASYLDPVLRQAIDAQVIVRVGLPAVNSAVKFAALFSEGGSDEAGGASVGRLPPNMMGPVLIEAGLHILHMPPHEQEEAAQVYVAAATLYQGERNALYSSLLASAEEGPSALAFQVIDTLGKEAIRAGERPDAIAARLGVVDHQWLLIQLADQHARGQMEA